MRYIYFVINLVTRRDIKYLDLAMFTSNEAKQMPKCAWRILSVWGMLSGHYDSVWFFSLFYVTYTPRYMICEAGKYI